MQFATYVNAYFWHKFEFHTADGGVLSSPLDLHSAPTNNLKIDPSIPGTYRYKVATAAFNLCVRGLTASSTEIKSSPSVKAICIFPLTAKR